ncbi:hypothetical protein N665_0383s0036 [Sinapis alba]|nr:hypothetical protein N665_0383s0036 [Sinapis alba]
MLLDFLIVSLLLRLRKMQLFSGKKSREREIGFSGCSQNQDHALCSSSQTRDCGSISRDLWSSKREVGGQTKEVAANIELQEMAENLGLLEFLHCKEIKVVRETAELRDREQGCEDAWMSIHVSGLIW